MSTKGAANSLACVFVAMLIACGSTAPRTQPQPHVEKPTPDAGSPPVEDPGPSAIVKTSPTRAAIESPHGGAIATLAVTFDGSAAVTVDHLGGARLWPALDGSLEPRVIDLPRPRQLAIARDPRGYAIAMIDEVGGLGLYVVDANGATLQSAVHGFDPPHVAVTFTEQGPLVLRSDQRLMRFAMDGKLVAQLVPDAAQRVLEIATTGPRTIAVIAGGRDTPWRRARWISTGTTLAWGSWIPDNDEIGDNIALSPSGKRFAYTTGARNARKVTAIDTGTGKAIISEQTGNTQSLAFGDDNNLAADVHSALTWFDMTGTKPRKGAGVSLFEQGGFAGGGGRVIMGHQAQLLLAERDKHEWLGYAMLAPQVMVPAAGGGVLVAQGDAFAILDGALREKSAPDLLVPTGNFTVAARWLGGDEWLVEMSRPGDNTTSVALVDTALKKRVALRQGMAMASALLYEPTSHVVAISLGEQPELLQHMPGKLKLDRIVALPKASSYERTELAPLDPKVANGTQVVVIEARERATIRWVRDARAIDKGVSVTIDGAPAGVDPTGIVFVWETNAAGLLELAMYLDAKRIGTLPTDGPTAIWPHPKGGQVVQVAQRSVGVVGLDGKQLWARPLQGVAEAMWLTDGSIAITSATGIARLDGKTGEPRAVRCGWKFGLSAKQQPHTQLQEPLCTQLR